tara:strand:+ start:2807 stop:3277 length:471 start_codon:yes stop_codon:yes gene_type:complete
MNPDEWWEDHVEEDELEDIEDDSCYDPECLGTIQEDGRCDTCHLNISEFDNAEDEDEEDDEELSDELLEAFEDITAKENVDEDEEEDEDMQLLEESTDGQQILHPSIQVTASSKPLSVDDLLDFYLFIRSPVSNGICYKETNFFARMKIYKQWYLT